MAAQIIFILISRFVITLSHHVFGLEDKTVNLLGDIFKIAIFMINLWWGFVAAEEFKWYNIVFSLISGSLFVTMIMVVPESIRLGNLPGVITAIFSQIIYWEILQKLKIFTFKKGEVKVE